MSTLQNCTMIEHLPGEWWLLLEGQETDENDDTVDTGEWTAYGPFTSKHATEQYLSRHFANPGTWTVSHHTPGIERVHLDEITAARALNVRLGWPRREWTLH